MTITNNKRTALTFVLTIILIASLVGTWMVASAFTVNTKYTVVHRGAYTLSDGVRNTDNPSDYDISAGYEGTTWLSINGQVYSSADVASSFTVNQLYIAALGQDSEDEDGYVEVRLSYRKSTESTWYQIDNKTTRSGTKFTTTPLFISQAGTYIFWAEYNEVYDDEYYDRSAYLTITIDPTLGKVDAPYKHGKVFTGWYVDQACTTPYTGQVITSNTVLYAGYRPVEFDIVFDANGGTGTMASEHVAYDGNNTVSMRTSFTKPGYVFAGWMDEYGYEYYPDDDYDCYYNLYEDGETVTLYAQWEEAEFYVTLNANGGSVSPSYKYVTYNSTYGTLPTPTRTGYTFKGWFTATSGGTQVTSTTNVTITTDQTLYAQWTANNYTVKFDSQGGSAVTDKSVTYDSTYGTLATPTRTGYTFKGWFTSTSGGTQVTSSTKVVITSTQTLYAQWTANNYTVKFDSQGGSTIADKSVTYDSTYGTLSTPTRTGYTFKGWFTSTSGGTQVTADSKVAITSTQTLYAQWTANSYTVNFDSQGGSTVTDKSVTYDSAYGTLATPTRRGFVFLGWFTSTSGGTQVTADSKVAITATQTLYARWRAVEFDITFNANGGNGTMASEHVVYNGSNNVNMACAFTKEGYTFGGWRDEYNNLYVEDTGSSMDDLVYNLYNDGDNVTLYAIWDANEYKVVFHANGATSGTMLDQTLTYDRDQSLTANAFIRQYTVTFNFNGNGTAESSTVVKATFNGWATSANGATVYNDKQSVKNLSTGTTINLYANWTLGTVTLPTPTRTGYTFKGWYTATCGGTKVGDAGATYTPTGAITLHAQWTANGFAVNFDANGGTGSMTEQGFVFDTAQNLIANSFTREGYTFTGWNTKADGTGASYTDKQSVTNIAGTNASITLYAQWTANKYTVTFDINCEGGEGSMNSQSFTYDDEPTELAQNGFTREGYTFIGWSTTKGGSAEYMDKEKVKNLTATNNGTVTLYAVWQINRYSVTFVDAETGETIAVVVVDWGTPSDQVVGQEVNTVLYKLEEGQELPN